jgi:SRSO17 transposase
MHTVPQLTETTDFDLDQPRNSSGRRSARVRSIPTVADSELFTFCSDVFASLARSDQRRCAGAYLQGLIHGTGRKSTRRIASELAGRQSDQALQQFVNQSPWDPAPVRLRLAELVAGLADSGGPVAADTGGGPAAWFLEEVAFAKNGRCSAAVEKQFVPTLGRVANAQVAATLTLTTPELSVPVDWRLCLPQSWDEDEPRRSGAHVPQHERHQPYWQYLVDLVDELTVDWGLSAAPIAADLSGSTQAGELVGALHERGLGYLVKVGARQPMGSGSSLGRPDGSSRAGTIADLAMLAARTERRTVTWRSGLEARQPRSQFVTVPVLLGQSSGPGSGRPRPVRVLMEWPLSRAQPTAFWLTNLMSWPVESLVALAKLDWRSRLGVSDLTDRFGLCDYEGRSFLGWHHHVTLVSAAYTFRLLQNRRAWSAGSDVRRNPVEAGQKIS